MTTSVETTSAETTSVHQNRPTGRQWAWFALQCAFVGMVQVANDIIRGNIWPPSTAEAIRHAHDVISLETRLGFFVEPSIQHFFLRSPVVLGVTIPWPLTTAVCDAAYSLLHLLGTLTVGIWIFVWHRRTFPFLRNIMLLTGVAAFVGYEIFPLAPPRLTPAIVWQGHPFHFQDTMQHIIGTGKLHGVPIGYNAYSAMPSLHVAWALILGTTILLVARHPVLRTVGLLYPWFVTFVTIVTGNHYVMDAVGALAAAFVGVIIAVAIEWQSRQMRTREALHYVPAADDVPAGG